MIACIPVFWAMYLLARHNLRLRNETALKLALKQYEQALDKDPAFARAYAGQMSYDQLVAILTYHVVPGSLMAKKVVGATGFTTLNGQRIDISANKKGAMVDGAKIV